MSLPLLELEAWLPAAKRGRPPAPAERRPLPSVWKAGGLCEPSSREWNGEF